MTSLREFKPLLLKRVMSLVIIASIIFALFYLISKQQASPSTLSNVDQPKFEAFLTQVTNLDFSNLTTPQNLPKSLPVYTLVESTNLAELSSQIASKLGISSTPIETADINFGPGKIFSNPQGVLIVYKNIASYQKLNLNPKPASFDASVSINAAKNFLNNLGLDTTDFILSAKSFQYLDKDQILETTDLQKSTFMHLDFIQQLENIPVVSPQAGTNISMDSDNKPILFSYQKLNFSSPTGSYPLIDFKQALTRIQSGKGNLISFKGDGYVNTIKRLPQTNITSAYLAYYVPAKSPQTIQPIWAFDGESTINNSIVFITLATPAISEKYFSVK